VGPRAGLDERKISYAPGFDPGPSGSHSVAIPTELPGPHTVILCTIKYYTILYFTIILLYYTILYCTVLYCTVLYYPTIMRMAGMYQFLGGENKHT
jgi:hypothetical protein